MRYRALMLLLAPLAVGQAQTVVDVGAWLGCYDVSIADSSGKLLAFGTFALDSACALRDRRSVITRGWSDRCRSHDPRGALREMR